MAVFQEFGCENETEIFLKLQSFARSAIFFIADEFSTAQK